MGIKKYLTNPKGLWKCLWSLLFLIPVWSFTSGLPCILFLTSQTPLSLTHPTKAFWTPAVVQPHLAPATEDRPMDEKGPMGLKLQKGLEDMDKEL